MSSLFGRESSSFERSWWPFGRRGVRVSLSAMTAIIVVVLAFPAQAQQFFVPASPEHDRVRVSGLFWRAKPSGRVDFTALSDVPGFEDGVDFSELGLDQPATGWIVEGNVAAGRRHRFIVEFSRIENTAEATIEVGDIPPFIGLVINARATVTLREFHADYNFLFVARPEVEAGLLAGVDWLEANARVSADIGAVSGSINQAFPTFGANLLVYPKGPVRGYVELSGFPRVTIEDLSGWQLDFVARAEVFVIRNLGFLIGYRRYRLVLDFDDGDVALDAAWGGLTIGAQARF